MPTKTFQLDVVSVRLVKESPILSEENIDISILVVAYSLQRMIPE